LRASPGIHHVTLSHEGYQNEYREVQVGDTAVDWPQIALRQPEGTLFVSSTPAGASIRVDGKLLTQVTPAALKLPPGSYSITVEKSGTSRTETIRLTDGIMRLSLALTP
jgi:hypothetical protein